ncbi:NAD-dependent epimerase/dehydratase family protein [Mesorhizobium koreense]|uniref:NAD-dependent epimerase/dehydratase family protein n=1 Tax=Mesorhizobium koreense TaxID=3074855 RepID=UPI00287BB328|nr:NAD-dependent epimerase/dehydratase family protein [Mesorhizobium sp. WR6]
MADNHHPIVAVTGSRGPVGEAVVRQLGESGFTVRRLSRNLFPGDGSRSAILPPFDAPNEAFEKALAGAVHTIHAAALNNGNATAGEDDFMNANARLTERLAAVAHRVIPGRFVFISSIRAVVGQGFGGTVGASTPPAPSCSYGRSKRAGEIAASEIFANSADRLTILRPAPVYGRGMKGNLGKLLRLAGMPYPLPLAGLANRRSLLDVEALGRAIIHALANPTPVSGAYIVSDRKPVTIPEIIAAFRHGAGRSSGLFYLPPALLETFASLTGQRQALLGMFTEEICDPSALEDTGWIATENSVSGLMALARPPLNGAEP